MQILRGKMALRLSVVALAILATAASACESDDFKGDRDGGDADTDTETDTGTDTDTGTAECDPVGDLPTGECPMGNRRCCAGPNAGLCFSIVFCPFCCDADCVRGTCD